MLDLKCERSGVRLRGYFKLTQSNNTESQMRADGSRGHGTLNENECRDVISAIIATPKLKSLRIMEMAKNGF